MQVSFFRDFKDRNAVKRKPSTSVANFDTAMLVAWYTALCNASSTCPTSFFRASAKYGDRKCCKTLDSHRNARFRTIRPTDHARYLLLIQVRPVFLASMTALNFTTANKCQNYVLYLYYRFHPQFLHLSFT